jgi:hypothetical protein
MHTVCIIIEYNKKSELFDNKLAISDKITAS